MSERRALPPCVALVAVCCGDFTKICSRLEFCRKHTAQGEKRILLVPTIRKRLDNIVCGDGVLGYVLLLSFSSLLFSRVFELVFTVRLSSS